jgi:2-hydroxychromene-2-carboxylate isomerase
MTASVDWYFDFVSPFSYISLYRLKELPATIVYKPVLFAGLLKHWGQKGPPEVPPSAAGPTAGAPGRRASSTSPSAFPSSTLSTRCRILRLALACGSHPDAVKRIFDWIWMTGENATGPDRFAKLCAELGVPQERLMEAKDALRKNTEEAVKAGVFGVPSFVAEGEVFWGADSIDFVGAFLRDQRVLRNDEMRRLDALPIGAERKP